MSPPSANPNGFWGPVTSSVDWCEANYLHSDYVCELFNTLSSVAILIAGLLGLALHARLLEKRFVVAYAMLSMVGIGSVAFHATLRFELQMLDELPMLYLAIAMVYILLENRREQRFARWLPAVLALHAVLVTYLCAFTRGTLQFWVFHLSFGSLEFFGLYRAYRLQRASSNPVVRRLFRRGITLYFAALVFWFTDLRYCGTLNELGGLGLVNPQLHAIWHVLVSLGFYVLLLVIAYARLELLGKQPKVLVRWLVPRLVASKSEL